jgi:hypothetical protein
MDDEVFKQKLSEVAEWRVPKLKEWQVEQAKQKARGKGRPTSEDLYQEEHNKIFLEIFNGVNPTYAPEITKVKRQAVTCGDCGEICEQGRRTETKFCAGGRNEMPYRKERCVECNLYRDPDTGKFTVNTGRATHVFAQHAKNKWAELNSEKKALRTQSLKTAPHSESNITITSYPENLRNR